TMPTIVRCPHCAAGLQVPDGFLGKKVRCARCQAVVTAAAPAAVVAPAEPLGLGTPPASPVRAGDSYVLQPPEPRPGPTARPPPSAAPPRPGPRAPPAREPHHGGEAEAAQEARGVLGAARPAARRRRTRGRPRRGGGRPRDPALRRRLLRPPGPLPHAGAA